MCYNVLGDNMKVAKLRKVEEKKKPVEINDEMSIKNLIITVIIILLVLTIFYFITTLVVKPLVGTKKPAPVQFDSSKITMGQLKTRSEKEYYVLALKESNHMNLYSDLNYTELYNNYISAYSKKDGSLKFYRIDMDDALNSSYWGDTFDIKTLTINDDVLFKISNKEIVDYKVGSTNILNYLKQL